MKIITIGSATQDVFIVYENAETLHFHTKNGHESFIVLREGAKLDVKELVYSSGGGANNAAFSFKKLGFDVTPCLKIGADEAGNFVLKKLKEAKIPTNLVLQKKNEQTGISFIIPSLEHDRTILAFRGVNTTVTQHEFPFDELKNYDLIYITSLSGNSSKLLPFITQTAKKHSIPVAINPGVSQLSTGAATLKKSLPNIDILILNSSEAQTFMQALQEDQNTNDKMPFKSSKKSSIKPSLFEKGATINNSPFNIYTFFKRVLSYGPRVVIVTNGAEGVYLATKDAVYFHASLPDGVVNTLGAGDAFGSTFVGMLAMGETIEQALRYGVINAASVIGFMDTKQGLLTKKELEKREKTVDKALLQTFKIKI